MPPGEAGYTEDNTDLSSGPVLPGAVVPTPDEVSNEAVDLVSTTADDRIRSLQLLLVDLAEDWPSGSLATCYEQIPHLHPIAAAICSGQDWEQFTGDGMKYHIYTDGSARPGAQPTAAWAFHILVESRGVTGPVFHRVGYTGALVDTSIWSARSDSLDAEAFAIIFAADWLLSLPMDLDCTVHFDATGVGCGAFGTQNAPAPTGMPRLTQHLARVLIQMAQARHTSVTWRHVKAHAGQPDNEAVDSIAHAICCGWQAPFNPPQRLSALVEHPLRDWAWLECHPTEELPGIEKLLTTAPAKPSEDTSLWQIPEEVQEAQVTHIQWKIGTANVRTMNYATNLHSAKLLFLRQQLIDQTFDVFAFQECRGRCDQCIEDDQFVRVCTAAQRGHGGLELWLRKQGAFYSTGLGEICKEQLTVWHTSPTVLGVFCGHPAFCCNIIVIYAPQSGRAEQEIRAWWADLVKIIHSRPPGGPITMLGDANAHLGSVTSQAVGDLSPDIEDCAGAALRAFCSTFDLGLPATFPSLHRGSSTTFVGPWRTNSRVDYIALPQEWMDGVEYSATCPELDLLTEGEDHIATMVTMTLHVQPRISHRPKRCSRYDRIQASGPQGQEWLAKLPDYLSEQPWQLDVNDHWHALRSEVLETCENWFPKQRRRRRQHYMSDALWQIVESRKDIATALRQMSKTRTLRALQGIFVLWRGDRTAFLGLYAQDVMADQVYAMELNKYDVTSQKFLTTRRRERQEWMAQCAQNLQDGLSRSSFSQWHKLLRPKRAIKQKTNSRKRVPGLKSPTGEWLTTGLDVSLMWQRHFGKIENAEEGTPAEILARSVPTCHNITVDTLLAHPTLFDLERAIRGSNPWKAAGPDQIGAEVWRANTPGFSRRCFALFLKSGLRGQWVAEFAGGDLVPLYKKGDPAQPANYRAILLEPTLGRIFSRAWRTRMVQALQMVQEPLQFGGHTKVSIELAHLVVRNAQQISHARRLSCAMIFADLRAAFYTVAKPFLTGDDTSPEAVAALFEQMRLPVDTLGAFMEAIEEGVVIPEADPTRHLQTVVAAMLRHTWAKVPGSDRFILPRTGSRPGDPLADTLFAFLMAKALHNIARRFDMEELTTTWDDAHPLAPGVTWVDDAIFHIEAPAAELKKKTTCALRILHEEMLRIGMRLNYESGKTEVLACFWGRHSTQSAQAFYKQAGGVFQVWNEFDGVLQVRAVPHYKHLGGFVTRTMSLHPELRIRRAQMHQHLHGIKHSALADTALPNTKRQALLHSLGLTVLTLHSGTWRPLRKCEWVAWHGATTSAYQYLHKRDPEGKVAHQTTLALAVAADAPMPHGLIFLRRLRVFTSLCRLGPGVVLDNVLCNHRLCGTTSWLSGLQDALQWARANADDYDWIPELDLIDTRGAWELLHCKWWQARQLFRKVEKAHKLRNKMCLDLQVMKSEQDEVLLTQGWSRGMQSSEPSATTLRCPTCDFQATTQAALSVHEYKKHGVRVAARRFAQGSTCVACARTFHTRPRLLLHLQYGTTRCLVHLLRHVEPLSLDESLRLDAHDVSSGQALHQKGLKTAEAQQPYFDADEDMEARDIHAVTEEELSQWACYGSLPAWMTGREPLARPQSTMVTMDAIEELSACEARWFQEAEEWSPPQAQVPKALSESRLFFLVFFSGHRRYGDLVSWIEWTCDDLVPLPIDLAIDSVWGDARKGGLWADLIRDGRVAGAHFGPPCETYTDARWLEVIEEVERRLPRPLRNGDYGWGMPNRSIKELRQVEMGNHLLWFGGVLHDAHRWCWR